MKKHPLTTYCLLLTVLACAEAEKTGTTAVPTGTETAATQPSCPDLSGQPAKQAAAPTAASADAGATTANTDCPAPPAPKQPVSTGAVIATTDYAASGAVAHLKLGATPESRTLTDTLELIGSDPIARAFGSNAYIINRFGSDNIQILDPKNNFKTSKQYSVGKSANPHDILELSATKAYVTRYESPYDDILIVNPSTGDQLGSISLKSISRLNKTSTPRPHLAAIVETASAAASGGSAAVAPDRRVFVTLQNLDSAFSEVGAGLLAVIDPATDKLVDTNPSTAEVDGVDLGIRNPGGLAVYKGQVYVIGSGDFLAAKPEETAGLVKVDPKTYAVQKLVSGTALGGRPNDDIAISAEGKGYLSITDRAFPATFSPYVVAFDSSTGALGAKAYTGSSTKSTLPEFEIDTFGFLHILDQDPAKPGVVTVDTKTNAVVTDRFQTKIAPVSIAILTELK